MTIKPDDLRRMREQMELSQAELAEAIGLGQNGERVIRAAEEGRRGGRPFTLTPLAANCVRYLYGLHCAFDALNGPTPRPAPADRITDALDGIYGVLPAIMTSESTIV